MKKEMMKMLSKNVKEKLHLLITIIKHVLYLNKLNNIKKVED
jgi:hypothetical protein